MSKHEVFKGLNAEEERDITREARLTYGLTLRSQLNRLELTKGSVSRMQSGNIEYLAAFGGNEQVPIHLVLDTA